MRESPPPPQSLCSAESERASGRGRGAGRRGAGGRWLRPAHSLGSLGPSAAPAGPRGRSAPPYQLAPGRPHAPLPANLHRDSKLPLCSQSQSHAPVLSWSST